MAKIPQPPKPKLPKPKKSLGQHIKDNTRKAAASSLRRNFGVLGNAIAKKYLAPPRVKTTIRVEPDLGNKKINKKKLKTEVTPDVSILESAKQVTNAVEIVTSNASRGFARVSRQVDTMGEEVTKAMNELSGVLDRMLYRKPPAPAPEAVPTGPQRVETAPAAGGGGIWPWLARLLPLAGILFGTYAMRRTSKQKEDMYNEDVQKYGKDKADELKRTRNWGITGWLNNKLDDAVEMFSGKSPAVGGKKQIGGGENIIHKMKYSADKIKFIASGTIEFKSKITEAKSSTAKPPSAGFFNDLADKLIGGRGGGGYAGGGGKDGKGGGPDGGSTGTPSSPHKLKSDGTKTTASPVTGEGGVNAAVDRAEGLLGKNETEHNADIQQYLKSGGAGMDPAKAAWCAAFVNASLQQSGVTGTNSLAAGSFRDWGQSVKASEIRKGDVLINRNFSPRTGMLGSHVGFATGKVDPKTGNIEMISGNANHPGDGGGDVHHDWIDPGTWDARRATEKEDPRLKANDTPIAQKFLNIDPAENKEASGAEPYEFPKARPRKAWKKMKPVGYDGHTGEYRVDDRRNEPDPYDSDPATVEAMDAAAYAKVPELLRDIDVRDAKYFVPTPLGYAAGGRDLLDINPTNMSHQYEMIRSGEIASWDTLRPPNEPRRSTRMVARPENSNPTTRSPSIISQYEDTHLDHRPQQDAVPDTDFSSYMDVK